MQEEFRDIPGYEGIYQVSNLGNVKSLPRNIYNYKGSFLSKEKVLKPGKNSRGYYSVNLFQDSKVSNFQIHILVAKAFLGHQPCGHKLVVDHINNDKSDNSLENLQLITHRVNLSKDKKGVSKYTGVHWCNAKKRWVSKILINGKQIHLGSYNCELAASLAYQNKLKTL